MKTGITIRAIVIGLLIGAAFFFVPFILIPILIIGLFFSLFRYAGRGRYGAACGGGYPGYTDYIRNMTDEEYAAFRERRYPPFRGRGFKSSDAS